MTTIEPPRQAPLLDIDQTLRQAVEHHQAGRQEEAVALYQSILQADPRHAEANNNMGAMAVEVGQPAGGLPYFMAALEADPSRERYWLNYIDALFQADQVETAREVLALARQQGLEGEEVDTLAARMEGGALIAEEPNAKPARPDTPAEKSAPHAGRSPSPKEMDSLVTLFGRGRFAEAATLAQAMTVCFPQHEFGWKALGAAYKQMGRTADALVPMQRAAALSPRDVEAHFNLGVTLQDLGRLGEAEASYRRALEINPDYLDAHGNLGVILKDLRRLNEAEACFRRALEIKPDNAGTLSNLGVALQDLGRMDEAEACFRRALQINPDNPESHNNLGNTLKGLGHLGDAEASYRRALDISPSYADAHSNLGIVLQELGRPGDAEASYRRALEIKPDMAETLCNLGITLKDMDRLDEAEAMLRRALQINPDSVNAHGCLGIILHDLDRLEEAEASCRRALEITPDIAGLHCNLGGVLHNLDRLEEAEVSYRKALEIDPELAEAHFGLGNPLNSLGRLDEARASYAKAHQLGFCGARTREAFLLPAIMGTRQEVLKSRGQFEQNLDQLIADKLTIDDPLKSVGEANFFLAYHGLNDRDLQVKVAKYYEHVCPSLLYVAPHCIKPKSDAPKKIRVGFLSKFLYKHSVSLCFSKIIETLSLKEQFQVTLISNQPIDEKLYSEFVGQRVQLPYNLVRAREMIAALELDVLVYLDIGMEPLGYFLAFSRLARTQCVLGGHPVTTGIGNMDYFLSVDRMEPLDAVAHYSEKLVRLPKPLAHFERPALPAKLKSRHELNLPTGRHIYMCPMSLQKLHPDFDEAIAGILQLDGNGVVVLFEDWRRSWWKTALLKRFEITIPAELGQRIVFLPWLKDPADFISAVAAADVVLDPFHFGIGSTVAMTSITGTPLVTKAGEFMRGRVGAYYCEMFDLAECIAEDTKGYVRKAVEIASDSLLQERIKANILKYNPLLYEDQQPVKDLADFFFSLMDGWRNPLKCELDTLAVRLEGSALVAGEPKAKPARPDKPARKSAPQNGGSPDPQEMDSLVALFGQGRLAETAVLAQEMTVRFPQHEFGWKALGAVYKQMGRTADALVPMQRAAELSPRDVKAHFDLGVTLQELGRLGAAETSYRRALEINPDYVEARVNLGAIFHNLGRLEDAEASYLRALEIKSDMAETLCNLGITLKDMDRLDEAEAMLRRALQINPDSVNAHGCLGIILHDLDRLEEAEASYRRVLEITPDVAGLHCNLGDVLHSLDRLEEAEVSYRKALGIDPELAEAHFGLGNPLKSLGRLDEAKASYARARQLGFGGVCAKEALMLPAIMGTRQEVLKSRSEFERNLDTLLADKLSIDDPLKSVGETNFFLAYHGLNDRDLQVKVAKYYEHVCPSLLYVAPHCITPKSDAPKKIRVGFLSKFLYKHPVSLCFSKMIETLSLKEQFQVTLISNQPIDEKLYSEFVGQRVQLPYNLVRAREMIAALELDVLVYLDIGMEPLGYFLAFSRLARTQCVLGGHPVTTGIGNMDYFLSVDRMEPLDAVAHYSEKLVRLPKPLAHFERPALPAKLKSRHELNLPTGRHIYMCPMSLQKLHPDFDEAIAGILQLDGNGVVVLFEDWRRSWWKTALLKRFEITIPAELGQRIVFLPWLKDPADFISAVAAADVVLDPFHFGIGSTVAMTSITGTPLVTKAGEFMRGRVGAYYCEMFDLAECIAEDTKGYVRKAVEIASDSLLQERIKANILKYNPLLYEDQQPVKDLADFFFSLMDGWRNPS